MNESTQNTQTQNEYAPDTSNKMNNKRKRLFILLGLVIIVVALSWSAYWYFYASKFVSTDNAYTATEVAQITPSVSGTVQSINVVDTQHVKKGDVLVVIDQIDAQLALNQAKADQSQALAQLDAAQSDYARAQIDLQRRQALISSGSVSADELTRAKNAFTSAKAHIDSAHAAIAQAKAREEQAKVDLSRTILRAPIDGIISKRNVQIGQKVQAGSMLMAVVPIQDVHVDANFKEGQLTRVRPGQSATVTSDIHGTSIVYHGTVEGFSGGTGSAFALIPAQNATGNWIKVVQRLPVRIKLDSQELKQNPLQVGLSMNVSIDTSEQNDQ